MPRPDPQLAFDLNVLLYAFPDTAETLLLDRYLTDRDSGSVRLFRIYRPAPAHFHRHSDEHLLVLSGRGRVLVWPQTQDQNLDQIQDQIRDPPQVIDFAPGTLVCFERNVVHATPELFEHPVVFLAFDAPRRQAADIVYVNPANGDPAGFIREV